MGLTADQARLLILVHKIRQKVPGFEVAFKDESRSQRFLGKLLFFVAYMTDFITTFYPKVWWTTRKDYEDNPRGAFKTLAHEYIHLLDTKRSPMWFRLSYIMPLPCVVFSLVSLGAIWSSLWFLSSLAALVFLAPWPAYWRMRWEMRGYAMSMAVVAWESGSISDSTKESIAESFTGWSYYKMWPFKRAVRKLLDDLEKQIHTGDIMVQSPAFQEVKEICDASDEQVIKAAEALAA